MYYDLFGKKVFDRVNTTQINDAKALQKYTNCISEKWQYNTTYIEHPRKPSYLIRIEMFNNYIVNEQMSDIAAYIMEHLALEELEIGLVRSMDASAGGKATIEGVPVGINLICILNSNFILHYTGTDKKSFSGKHVWVAEFPDIRLAVENRIAHMEKIQEIHNEFVAGFSAEDIAASVGMDNKTKFYIRYTAKK